MKKIGFLSFGHWATTRHSAARSARDVLQQSIELAVAAEQLGADGAYFRVHHFAQQLASPSLFSQPLARGRAASRSERPSSTCGTRIRSTWWRTRARPI